MRISRGAMAEIEQALREYENEVDASNLSYAAKRIYESQANRFVRWLKGEFTPGERK